MTEITIDEIYDIFYKFHYFFLYSGVSTEVWDKFYNLIGKNLHGKIDFVEWTETFGGFCDNVKLAGVRII